MKELHNMGVAELGRALADRQASSVEITTHLLARLSAHEQLGTMLCVDAAHALEQARAADARRHRGKPRRHSSV